MMAMPAVAQTTPSVVRVDAEWPRIMLGSGVGEGDRFRLLFVTSESYPAWHTDIDHYNGLIQDLVRRKGHYDIHDIRKYAHLFKVVGGTADVPVYENTAMGQSGVDAKIYWMAGGKVADDYDDFFDGSWQNEHAPRYEGLPGFVWMRGPEVAAPEAARLRWSHA